MSELVSDGNGRVGGCCAVLGKGGRAPLRGLASAIVALAALAGCSMPVGGELEGLPSDADEAGLFREGVVDASAGGGPRDASASSSPIALSRDGRWLWAVSPDTDSVTLLRTDTRQRVARVTVGKRPESVAIDPQGRFVYVANAESNDVSVISLATLRPSGFAEAPRQRRVVTGGAPASVLVAPDGRHVFVANSSQDTVTVLDARSQRVSAVLDLRGSACNAEDPSRHFQPRGLAMTADGEHLFVTRFLSYTRPGGTQRDDFGKEGLVCRVDLDQRQDRTQAHFTPVRLAPSDAGFVDRNGNPTGAFPNQLQSIVVHGDHAYLPNIAASPSGPLRFDVDTQAYVNRIDSLGAATTDGGALNLHLGARDPEPGKRELYFANPWAMAFTTRSGPGSAYVVSAASDVLVKLNVDAGGALRFTGDEDTTRYIDLNDPEDPDTSGANAGKNPVGIVIDPARLEAYVLNYVSRNVSFVDLRTDRVSAVVSIEDLPAAGSQEELLLVGAELFYSSRGNFVRPDGVEGSTRDRLSEKGHQACSSCHAAGLTDGVVWQFNSGPRKTIAINGTTNPRNREQQRIINYSAIFDELEDVDFNTRRVSSGEPLPVAVPCADAGGASSGGTSTNDPSHGLILGSETDLRLAPCTLVPFAVPNEDRPQLRVQLPGSGVLVKATDALKAWQRYAVRTPNRALTDWELSAAGLRARATDFFTLKRGRRLFEASGCGQCHGTGQWTSKKKDFVSPPAPEEVARETAPGVNGGQYLARFLTDVGTFELNVAGSSNTLPPYEPIGGVEKDANGLEALGYDYDGDGKGNGYNTPSLLGAFSVPPYFHNGACETLECVLTNVTHRRAARAEGTVDPLDEAGSRAALTAYLESIDVTTPPHGNDD